MATYVFPAGCATAHIKAIDVSVGTVDSHVAAINELMAKFKAVSAEAEEIQRAVGERILAIRHAVPAGWEAIVKAKCGISRSRAFELMRIADGTTSAEETRRASKARKTRQRQKQAVRDVTDKKQLAAAQAQVIELRAAHGRQIERFKAEIARLSDGGALSSERDELRGALSKVEKFLAEARALTTHFRNNESDVVAKINRALIVARAALQPAKTVISAAKRAA